MTDKEHGTIYTTKLLRRGTDIARPKPSSVLQLLTVGDVMQPLDGVDGRGCLSSDGPTDADHDEHADDHRDRYANPYVVDEWVEVEV